MSFEIVAVGVDFSAVSLAALRFARTVVQPKGTIRLVHVIDSAVFDRGPASGDPAVAEQVFADLIRGARAELDAVAEELRVEGLAVELVVKVGRPPDQLLAAFEGASLVVVGTQGRGALGRFFIGSVAEEVARRSSIPVLVIRDGVKESSIDRVLVAVDPTGPARDAIRMAAALAERLGAKLEAIHAAYLPPVLPYAESGAVLKMTQVLEHHLEAAPAYVRNLIEKTIGSKGRDVKVHVVSGPPAHEIARYAGPHDVVVCGTHGRSALGRFVFGSVATKLLRETPCPLLVVRPAEDESSRDELVGAVSTTTGGGRRV